MKQTPIQIRNDAVVGEIRELSALTGKPITEAVAHAVRAELAREKQARANDLERKLEAVREISRRFRGRRRAGPPLTDDDLYDEDGMPK